MVPSRVLAALAELAPAGADRVLDVTRGGLPFVWLDSAQKAPRKAEVNRLAALGALHKEERPLRVGWGFLAGRAEIDGRRTKIRVPLLSQPVQLVRGLTGYTVAPAGDLEITPLIADRELAAALEAAPGVGGPGWLEAIGTKAWLWSAARATGLTVDAMATGRRAPGDRVVLIPSAALYVVRDVYGAGLADSLRSWAGRDLRGTALAAVYADERTDQLAGSRADQAAAGQAGRVAAGRAGQPDEGRAEPVLSPLPLTRAQAEVVARARTAPITVVSGPPGNGKSHTVVAAALEVVHRGGSVLIATQSPHAAEVLAGLLDRYPGPVPVLFGDAGGRERLAAELAAGAEQGVGERQLRADAEAVQRTLEAVRRERSLITSALELEMRAAELPDWQPLLPALAADVPGAFRDVNVAGLNDVGVNVAGVNDVGANVPGLNVAGLNDMGVNDMGVNGAGVNDMGANVAGVNVAGLNDMDANVAGLNVAGVNNAGVNNAGVNNAGVNNAGVNNAGVNNAGVNNAGVNVAGGNGPADRVAAKLARGRVSRWWTRWRLGVRSGVPDERVTEAVRAATAQRAAARLAAIGGTELAPRWAALHAAEAALAEAVGTAMRDAARSEKRWDREARRAAAALATALRAGRNRRRELLAKLDAGPLVRALPLWIGTVADVEDLLPAAPGTFDLVVLDEASHVDQVRAAPVLARARRALVVGDPRQLRFVSFVSDVDVADVLERHEADERLDVRRVSAFDLAAGAAPTTWLEEHHRSVPHLIGFSARRFYGDRLSVMTRSPATESADAIDVVRVEGDEVGAVLKVVEEHQGRGSIGVISPFRPQADALEAALVDAYTVEQIETLGLRAGTVHAFQGSEADIVVVSLGLSAGDPPARRRFVADPHLFNVMITRARRRLVVVTALDTSDGLLGEFFAYASGGLPGAAKPADRTDWAGELAAELERLGVEVRPGYEVGPWVIDLCAGELGVLCGPHPGGAQKHLERQAALHRAGWRLMDAFASRWQGDPRRAALEISAAVAADAARRPSGGRP
ncbi:AAA domain-containing protein [Paractinoplanes deccanensis]|uniref:AAA domain-containing protein n=1 Tax=Paractinoplanes deccanensis TaxID=113561 RepID=UPI003613372C